MLILFNKSLWCVALFFHVQCYSMPVHLCGTNPFVEVEKIVQLIPDFLIFATWKFITTFALPYKLSNFSQFNIFIEMLCSRAVRMHQHTSYSNIISRNYQFSKMFNMRSCNIHAAFYFLFVKNRNQVKTLLPTNDVEFKIFQNSLSLQNKVLGLMWKIDIDYWPKKHYSEFLQLLTHCLASHLKWSMKS